MQIEKGRQNWIARAWKGAGLRLKGIVEMKPKALESGDQRKLDEKLEKIVRYYDGISMFYDSGAIKRCIRKGADPNSISRDGWTPLTIAAKAGNAKACACLIKMGADPDMKDGKGRIPILQAAEAAGRDGDSGACMALAEGGANVNAVGAWPMNCGTALIEFARHGNCGMCRYLMQRGADVNLGNVNGTTALMDAAFHGHKKICELLLDCGADVNARGPWGETALMCAADHGYNYDVCELLVDRGADLNARNSGGNTALMVAARNERYGKAMLRTCAMLRSRGTDVTIKNNEGKTVFDLEETVVDPTAALRPARPISTAMRMSIALGKQVKPDQREIKILEGIVEAASFAFLFSFSECLSAARMAKKAV